MSEINETELAKKVFAITTEHKHNVRKLYGISQEEVDRDCEIIKNWMEQQNHIPDDYDKRRVERFLIRNKFHVERTKYKLENYYTLRGQCRNFLKKMDPRTEDMQAVFETMHATVLPKLMNGTDRIFFYRIGKPGDQYSLEHNILLLHAILEFELLFDCSAGVRFFTDCENLTMAHLKRLDFNMIAKNIEMFKEALTFRILSLDYINIPPGLNIFMQLIKQCIPEKLHAKINIHPDLDSLKKSIPEEYLPLEYEGTLPSLYDMHEDVKKLFLQNGDFLMKRLEMISNEDKRVGDVEKSELYGIDGTFKNINLD